MKLETHAAATRRRCSRRASGDPRVPPQALRCPPSRSERACPRCRWRTVPGRSGEPCRLCEFVKGDANPACIHDGDNEVHVSPAGRYVLQQRESNQLGKKNCFHITPSQWHILYLFLVYRSRRGVEDKNLRSPTNSDEVAVQARDLRHELWPRSEELSCNDSQPIVTKRKENGKSNTQKGAESYVAVESIKEVPKLILRSSLPVSTFQNRSRPSLEPVPPRHSPNLLRIIVSKNL